MDVIGIGLLAIAGAIVYLGIQVKKATRMNMIRLLYEQREAGWDSIKQAAFQSYVEEHSQF